MISGVRLNVSNFSDDFDETKIKETFEKFGTVIDVHDVKDRDTGKRRGFAFVTMGTADEARNALTNLNGFLVDGKVLNVTEAEERRPFAGKGKGSGGSAIDRSSTNNGGFGGGRGGSGIDRSGIGTSGFGGSRGGRESDL